MLIAGFWIRITTTIFVGRGWIVIGYFLFVKQTFNRLLKVIGILSEFRCQLHKYVVILFYNYFIIKTYSKGTMKCNYNSIHINRIRCARLIGMELAQFYLEADQVHQAIAFLADSLKTFQVYYLSRYLPI